MMKWNIPCQTKMNWRHGFAVLSIHTLELHWCKLSTSLPIRDSPRITMMRWTRTVTILVIDDKDGDCPCPPHHRNSGAVSDRERGGQLAPMELKCMYAEHCEPMPPVHLGLTGNIPLHHPQPQAQMSINQM